MKREYSEFTFDEDMELMNLTYQMNSGNFIDYNDYEKEKILNTEEINNTKIGL